MLHSLFHMISLKSGVYFTLTVHLNLGTFKGSTALESRD